MKKIILLAAVLAVFAGCKKSSNVVNSDSADRVFRIAASSDKNFTVAITEYKTSAAEPVRYATFGGNLEVNQGFTPAVGNKVNVRVTTATGSSLTVNLIYKGARVGPGANTTTADGITSDFTYDVKD